MVHMKTLGLALLVLALVAAPAGATEGQEAVPADVEQVLEEFGRAVSGFGATFMLVHLNDVTTDALFDAPLKYSLRAQARNRTMFYVQGEADYDVALNTNFRVQQGRSTSKPGPPISRTSSRASVWWAEWISAASSPSRSCSTRERRSWSTTVACVSSSRFLPMWS